MNIYNRNIRFFSPRYNWYWRGVINVFVDPNSANTDVSFFVFVQTSQLNLVQLCYLWVTTLAFKDSTNVYFLECSFKITDLMSYKLV